MLISLFLKFVSVFNFSVEPYNSHERQEYVSTYVFVKKYEDPLLSGAVRSA